MKNKIVLITGGTSGLGLATVKKFQKDGATILIASRSKEKFEKAFRGNSEQLHFIPTDFSDIHSLEALYGEIREKFEKLDIAINNVGSSELKPFLAYTANDFDNIMNVNFKSLWYGMKQQLLLMKNDKENHKHIINVSSINGLGGAEYLSIYAAAKAAVISLTKSVAIETAQSNISINAIVPGPFETQLLEDALRTQAGGNGEKLAAVKEQYKQFIPVGRFGNPEEFAETVYWLCQDKSRYLSGHSLILDGGMSSRFR